jgi:ankyrin repeat protein
MYYGSDPQYKIEPWEGSALRHAVKNEDDEMIKFLIRSGAKVEASDTVGTYFIGACKRGENEVVELIVKNVKGPKPDYDYALRLAVCSGYLRVIEILAKEVKDISSIKTESGEPLLLYISQNSVKNGPAIAKILIENGADIKAKNKVGYDALYYAIKGNDCEMIELLISKGADVDIKVKNYEGKEISLITSALLSENKETAKILKKNGAKMSFLDWIRLISPIPRIFS